MPDMRSVIAAVATLALASHTAQAFCGFYVSGSNEKMFNDATNVVLMRSGTRTVLSMQNDYRGPLEDFAMVVPVPVVLKPTDVKVVDKAVFDRLDSLGSPRLVEYWEQDPCPQPIYGGWAGETIAIQGTVPTIDQGSTKTGITITQDYTRNIPPSGRSFERPAVAPKLASFGVTPTTITAGVPTAMTWTFGFANTPWPDPSCTIDHGVGSVYTGVAKDLTLDKTTTLTLTCANSAGRAQKQVNVRVVKIEAKFDVAEYQIMILSATEAAGLEEWLRMNHYKIPEDAEKLLRPYIEAGSKFFVARVDPKKVKMVDGRVALSPLRFHYDTEEFSLPIRLGMANSSGQQDLIVNILSPDKRYEVANYKNVTIPTNFDVKPTVKDRFAEFYAALFDKTIERNPGAVVTEYAWTATPTAVQQGIYGVTCDPCPTEIPIDGDMMQLGADILGSNSGQIQRGGYVLTRLHARYSKHDMKDDLRFREGKPITGGREVWNAKGLEYAAQPGDTNYFQARYAIRHWWTGPMKCNNPKRGVWGGPPDGHVNAVLAAQKTAFAPRGKLQLAGVIKRDLWEIGFKKAAPKPAAAKPAPKQTMWFAGGALLGLLLVGSAYARRRRA
jgi:hypothetical protein